MARLGRGFPFGWKKGAEPPIVYPAPSATTNGPTEISNTGATLHGTVNPNGPLNCTTYFQYGPTNAYGTQTANQDAGTGTNPVAVNQTITGLVQGTLYHYRVVAVNATGTTYGADVTFTAQTACAAFVYEAPRLHILLGSRSLSERCDQVTFSATDTGGYETCSLGLPADDYALKGQMITIRKGCEIVWQGRVAERDDHNTEDHASRMLQGEGYRALLRDTDVSMVYVDRELARWADPSISRQIALLGLSEQFASSQAGTDPTNLSPALVQTIVDSWASPWTPVNESWYDAGAGNLIAKIYYNLAVSQGAVGTWSEKVALDSDDLASIDEISANLDPSGSGYFSPAAAYRFARVIHSNSVTGAGVQGATYLAYWQNLTAYGNHGLTGRGADPVGFWPSDIARHALSQCSNIAGGQIVDAIGFIAPHVVYRTPTPADQIIDDMAKLMGWTWGVWEPGLLGSSPRLDFRAPPTDATCAISRSECDQLDITTRLGDLYDVCEVAFTDAAGTAGLATVKLPNPLLYEAGIASRTLQLSLSLSSPAAAQTYGLFALALSQVAARAAGTVTLPVSVRLANGGSKPAVLLRPGLDRLRITDLPDAGNLFDQGTNRRDVFRISRVESTAARDGSTSTVAELDNGANLLETLQARLSLAAAIVGQGA